VNFNRHQHTLRVPASQRMDMGMDIGTGVICKTRSTPGAVTPVPPCGRNLLGKPLEMRRRRSGFLPPLRDGNDRSFVTDDISNDTTTRTWRSGRGVAGMGAVSDCRN
jgi:hypothetical protein